MMSLIIGIFFLLCTLHRASSKMKSATWWFNFKKILNTFLKAQISIFYFFELAGIKINIFTCFKSIFFCCNYKQKNGSDRQHNIMFF
jgi:hypothetical protein